jgi:hypothetical protein
MAKNSLVYVDYHLRAVGVAQKCLRYELSDDKTVLHVAYLDYKLETQFIAVFRTSALAYRIYHGGKLTTRRTAKQACEYLHGVLSDIIVAAEHYKVLTVAELNRLDSLTYSQKLELYKRGKPKNGI